MLSRPRCALLITTPMAMMRVAFGRPQVSCLCNPSSVACAYIPLRLAGWLWQVILIWVKNSIIFRLFDLVGAP